MVSLCDMLSVIKHFVFVHHFDLFACLRSVRSVFLVSRLGQAVSLSTKPVLIPGIPSAKHSPGFLPPYLKQTHLSIPYSILICFHLTFLSCVSIWVELN